MNKKIAFDFLVGICKINQFKKIQDYNEKMKWAIAIKRLFIPFIRLELKLFIQKCKYMNNVKHFNQAVTLYFKNKILQKILKYCANIGFLKTIVLPGIKLLKKIILKKYFEKIKNAEKIINININNNLNINNFISRSYLSKHYEKEDNKANSYMYESLDCEDSITGHPNSVDNDGLHQLKEIIEMQNENKYEENLENIMNENPALQYFDVLGLKPTSNNKNGNNLEPFASNSKSKQKEEEKPEISKNNENKIKTEIHLKEHLLQQIINSNQTSSEDIKDIKKDSSNSDINYSNNQEKKKENENLILTKINDEKENNENINNKKIEINNNNEIKNNNKIDNSIKNNNNNNNEDIINIIENDNENNENENDNENTNKKKFNNIITKILDENKFADELTEYIVSKILIEKEIKSPKSKLFPPKSGDFNLQKYNDFNLNSLINNNVSGSNNSLDSLTNLTLSDYTQNNSQILEKSMILQYSISSEFNKTIKEKKNSLESNLYNNYIIDKLILLICKEIKQNYSRIYDNISIPYKANYEQVIVASYLQDNELLNNSYKELKVKEDLKNIINKKKIIEKFNSINKKIRQLKGLEENNSYDNIINECIIDATIEIINKERPYGEAGEPFPFSKREREICFKYNKNDPKPLMKHVYKSLKTMLFGKGNIIKENSPIFDKNDPFLMNIFKKEMENENVWNELEIQEEQVKSIASNVIFDQLINEVIEILEHVQLNRKKPELYQNKSIYACDEIPRLSFQMISNNTENDETEADFVCS